MTLDVTTPKGRLSVEQEKKVAKLIEAKWQCVYAHTDKDSPAYVDSVIVRDGAVKAIAETKCRNATLTQLQTTYNDEWLITHEKLVRGQKLAKWLYCEYWGLLFLVPSGVVMRVRLWVPDMEWITPWRVERTETQATINGGKIVRVNAYISMARADILGNVGGEQ